MTQNQSLFFRKFGITPNDLQRYLGEALSAGGDYADLYFEYLTSTSISVDESIVKSATQGISAGCGVRVAKHGNRSISSKCGSADVMEALGVKIALPPARAASRWSAWSCCSR